MARCRLTIYQDSGIATDDDRGASMAVLRTGDGIADARNSDGAGCARGSSTHDSSTMASGIADDDKRTCHFRDICCLQIDINGNLNKLQKDN